MCDFFIQCSACGKRVSDYMEREPTVRAWIECPECVQARGDLEGDEHLKSTAKMRYIACDQLAGFFGSTVPQVEAWLDSAIENIDADDNYPSFDDWFQHYVDRPGH